MTSKDNSGDTDISSGIYVVAGVSFNAGVKSAIARAAATEGMTNVHIPYPLPSDSRVDVHSWGKNALVVVMKEDYKSMVGIYDNTSADTNVLYRLPVIATPTGLPLTMEPADTTYFKTNDEKWEDVQREMLLANFRCTGFSEGSYIDGTSKISDGININMYGTCKLFVPIDDVEPSPFSELQLWLPPVGKTSASAAYNKSGGAVPFTVREYDPKSITDYTRLCVSQFMNTLVKNSSTHGFVAVDKAISTTTPLFSQNFKAGHNYLAGILSICIRFVQSLIKNGSVTSLNRGTTTYDTANLNGLVSSLLTDFGIEDDPNNTNNGSLKPDAVKVLQEITIDTDPNHSTNLFNNLCKNAHYSIASTVSELVNTKSNIIGKTLQCRGEKRSGAYRNIDTFIKLT